MQVRELKAAKEEEQAAARGQIEALRLKLQREKNQELQVSDDTELVCESHVISDGLQTTVGGETYIWLSQSMGPEPPILQSGLIGHNAMFYSIACLCA